MAKGARFTTSSRGLNRSGIRSAVSYQLFTCSDPECGLHIIGLDANLEAEYEIIIPQHSFTAVNHAMHEIITRTGGKVVQ